MNLKIVFLINIIDNNNNNNLDLHLLNSTLGTAKPILEEIAIIFFYKLVSEVGVGLFLFLLSCNSKANVD